MRFTSTIKTIAAIGCCTLPLFAIAKEKKYYNVSAFKYYKDLPVNRDAAAKTRLTIAKRFPGWLVSTDKLSGAFTDINGAPVTVAGSTATDKARAAINKLLAPMGVNATEWVQTKAFSSPKSDFVNFKRVVDGHSVAFASLSLRFTKAGTLAEVKMKDYGNATSGEITISEDEVKTLAVKDISGLAITSAIVDAQWEWFPVPHAGGYSLHKAWHYTIKGRIKGETPMSFTGYVDATDGTLLYRTNEVRETGFDVTVKGSVYKNGTLNPATMEPLTDLEITSIVGPVYTDTAGLALEATAILPLETTIPLKGRWSTVIDSVSGAMPQFFDTILATGTTFVYPTLMPSSDRHVNAYYHVNRIHNFMKGYLSTFTGMDFSLATNVDLTSGNCNAFYDGTSINFYQADAQCNSFAEIGDIIYHEYGHGINDLFYTEHSPTGTMMNGAMHEAYADVWAMCVTGYPVVGENSFVGYGGFIRRYDKIPHVYPLDLNGFDPHFDGEVIAGCWWSTGQNLGGAAAMSALFTEAYYATADGPDGTEGAVYQQVLIDALMADDDDANLANGTPHYDQIIKGFARHGVYLEGGTLFLHTETNNMAAATPITLTATIDPDQASYLNNVKLNYRLNGTGSWSQVTATATGIDYSATIPGQPMGTTVEYYFTMYDALGKENGYFPIACNPNNASWESNIPYQFGVGLPVITSKDFEVADTAWHVGNNPGDDATAGKWNLGVPVPHSFLTAYASADHTGVGTKCLRSGNGSGGFLGTSVANGTSTVLSPIYNIGTYSNPVVEYFRWFSNEQGFDNQKTDPWVVQIRDAGTAGSWINVERTYQSETEWRRRIFRVKQYLPSANQIQIRFVISDSVLSNYNGDGQSIATGDVDDFSLRDNGDVASVNEINRLHATVSPNPANDILHIHLVNANSNGKIALYDATGRMIKETALTAGAADVTMSTSDVAPGIYFVSVQTTEGIETKKVAITH